MGGEKQLEFRVEARDGYVFVWQQGLATTSAELVPLQQAVETAMAEARTKCVLFDNRDTEPPDEYVRAAMWSWLLNHVTRAAMLQNEVRNVKRADRTGQRNRIALKAFMNEDEASAWLLNAADDEKSSA